MNISVCDYTHFTERLQFKCCSDCDAYCNSNKGKLQGVWTFAKQEFLLIHFSLSSSITGGFSLVMRQLDNFLSYRYDFQFITLFPICKLLTIQRAGSNRYD